MNPQIINFNSAFDWTNEVREIWEHLDWEEIRKKVARQIDSEQWMNRRDELRLIGLVSSLVIDKSYRIPAWEEDQEEPKKPDDPMLVDWRKRQMDSRDRSNDQANNQRPPRLSFNGEEPFFRSPRVGQRGIVECYGIYVDDAQGFLKRIGLADKAPWASGSAIFLCPERIVEVYSTIMKVDDLRHPLSLSANPMLANLRITLLHELGHHFFPVHRTGATRFLCEGLANRFCHEGLQESQQAWLLYKTWYLQPPEYSAYRPLKVLCQTDDDCRFATSLCFHGHGDGWRGLPKKDSSRFERNIGASLNMALAIDSVPCIGLGRELRQLVSEENRWFLHWDGNHLFHHFNRHDQGHMPADLVLDLYQNKDLGSWATRSELPCRIWGRWAHGEEVRWPHDCVNISEGGAEKWFEYYAQARDTPLASVICEKLVEIIKADSGAVSDAVLRPALDRAVEVATSDQAMWFDRVPAIQLLEACSDVSAIPALEGIASAKDRGDAHEAATKALATLRRD